MTSFDLKKNTLERQTAVFFFFSIYLCFVFSVLYMADRGSFSILFHEHAVVETVTLILYGIVLSWLILISDRFPRLLWWGVFVFILVAAICEAEIHRIVKSGLYESGYIETKKMRLNHLFEDSEAFYASVHYLTLHSLRMFFVVFMLVNVSSLIRVTMQNRAYEDRWTQFYILFWIISFGFAQFFDQQYHTDSVHVFWTVPVEELIEMTMPAQFLNIIVRLVCNPKSPRSTSIA